MNGDHSSKIRWLRALMGKGAHDYAADIVKGMIHWGVRALALGSAVYFGVDVASLFPRRHTQIETRSIKRTDEEAKRLEIECNVAKAREVDALTERRRAGLGDLYEMQV
jgi:hypothetical protein